MWSGSGSLLLSMIALPALGQGRELAFKLHGTTTDFDGGGPIAEVWVAATDTLDADYVINAQGDRKGRYEMELPYERVYRVTFTKEGHVTKQVIIDLHGSSEKERTAGFTMDLEMVLFERLEGVDYTVCDAPIAVCRYDPRKTEFAWDAAFTRVVKPRLQALSTKHAAQRRSVPRD